MKKEESILYKKLDLTFVYILLFIIGLIIVFSMVNYLKNKVNEIDDEIVVSSNN